MLSPIQTADDLNLSIKDCVSVSSLTSLSSDTFEDDFSFLGTESVSEDNSSIIHQFVNESEVNSNSISHSNISTGSAASINSSDSSSSITSITENESSIQVIDIQVNKFEDEIAYAIALDLNRFPRLTRDGTCVIKIHKKKQALLNERMLVLFTAIRWGWNNYNATNNQRKRIATAACRQVVYDRGFANNLASSQISA